MVIQYLSDLHLEFRENWNYLKANPIPAVGDLLILAGDITLFTEMDKHRDFFSYVSDHFPFIYWLPGNHEYYHFDMKERSGPMREKVRDNLFLVNNISEVYNHTRFIFSTLWSKISPVNEWQIEKRVNDFHQIRYNGKRFSASLFNQLHEESVSFIRSSLGLTHIGKTVVATHHVPTFLNYPPRYKGDIINEAFAVELEPLIEETRPDYWIFGHHHYNGGDFILGETTMLTNQLGYVRENEHLSFRADAHISV